MISIEDENIKSEEEGEKWMWTYQHEGGRTEKEKARFFLIRCSAPDAAVENSSFF